MPISVSHRRARRGAILLGLVAPLAAGHSTFKLPSIPGVSPNDAGGYVPLDGPFLSHSPFQLNVPHSTTGNLTVGMQCLIPTGLSVTPQEIPGWTLTLTTVNNVPTAFTYQINPDALSPNGFAQAGQHLVNGMRSNIAAFIGISAPPGSCTFNDPAAYAIVGGYPTVFFQCAELSVDETVALTPQGLAEVAAGRTTLYSLLWWATPANAVAECTTYTNTATGNPLPGASWALDSWSTAAPSGPACTRWPCSTATPFGRRSTAVSEYAGAPRITFVPRGCTGARCVAPFPGQPFTGCPGGTVTMPVTVRTWASSPCRAPAGSAGTMVATIVGNAPAIPSPPPPALAEEALSVKDIVIWLSVITAVFGTFCVCVSAWVCARALGTGAAPPSSLSGQVADKGSNGHSNGNGNGNGWRDDPNGDERHLHADSV